MMCEEFYNSMPSTAAVLHVCRSVISEPGYSVAPDHHIKRVPKAYRSRTAAGLLQHRWQCPATLSRLAPNFGKLSRSLRSS